MGVTINNKSTVRLKTLFDYTLVNLLPCALVVNSLSLIDGVGFVCTNSAEDVRICDVVDLSVTSGVGTEDLVGSSLTVKRVGGTVVDFKPSV